MNPRNIVWLFACVTASASANGLSDPFGTDARLRASADGLQALFEKECAAPAAGLSLARAVDIGLCRNPSTRAAWANARQQAAALGAAQAAWLPTLSASAGKSLAFGGQRADGFGGLVSESRRVTNAALSLGWTLYDFGGREARIDNAAQLMAAAAASAQGTAQQTAATIVQAYFTTVAADAQLGVVRQAESAYRESYAVARARQEGGMATFADVLQVKTALDTIVLNRVQVEGLVQGTRGALANAIGLPADQGLALAPEPLPDKVGSATERVRELIETALRQRPDLNASLAQRAASEAAVRQARAASMPTVAFSAGRSMTDLSGYPNQAYNMVGIGITIPLFSGYASTYDIRKAQAALEQTEAGVEQTRLTVARDVWAAWQGLQTAVGQLEATATLQSTARENEGVALGRYRAGVGTIIDLLTAQSASANALQQRVSAELAWRVSRAQLVLAMGALPEIAPR